ncbi:hypothetical protein PRIEUP_LOCUS14817 [Pristimantis euphronides]
MFFAHLIAVLIVAGTYKKATGQRRCKQPQYHNERENACCFRCPEGLVTNSACVKDVTKECATCSEPDNYIVWSQNHPTCATCKKCRKESNLVQIQKCSLLTEAICQCKPGYYCQTPLENSCARCNSFTQCPPGEGVKRKGTHEKDTECEICPNSTFSNVHSVTEACKPHTDCNKLHKVTAERGNATADAVCGGPKDPTLQSTENTLGMTHTRYAATFATTRSYTTNPDTTTSGTFTITTSDDAGKRSMAYIWASIICVISLLIAFFLYWKQKICNLKLWKCKYLLPEERLMGRLTTNMEGNKNLVQKENVSPEKKNMQSDWKMENQHEMLQGSDQTNNWIENIYIMNADTVLVGSISEASTRFRSVMTECESQESPLLGSRYPEQESSKLSAKDLMFSVEEEERESCKAKAILEV